nr:MAG TPA: hypothetical protein [Bacteriophage sp.]
MRFYIVTINFRFKGVVLNKMAISQAFSTMNYCGPES